MLKKKDHKQAWTKAGELNALLKKEEAKDLKPELVEQLNNELRGYYYINSEIEKANKRLYAKGSKLIELASLLKGGPMTKAKRYLTKSKRIPLKL